MRIIVSRRIGAPIEEVFRLMTDVAAWPEVIKAIERVEVINPGPEGIVPGTRFRETRTMFGQKAVEEMKFAEISPPERFVLTAYNHGTHYRAEHLLTRDGDGTLVRLVFEGVPETWIARLLSPLAYFMTGQVRQQLAADLEDLARATEG